MKKLTTPEMNVIRFNEADVIVASGSDPKASFTVKGVRNGIEDDATINYCNKEYKADNALDLFGTLLDNGLSPLGYNSYIGGTFYVDELLSYDERYDFSGFDGEWVYDPTANFGDGAFVKK